MAFEIPTRLPETLAQEGYAFLSGVLSPGQCDALNDAIAVCRAAPGPTHRVLSPPGQPAFESELFRWRDVQAFHDVAATGNLPALAGAVFDTHEVILMEDQWFFSEAGAGARSPWHQDHPYHPLEPWFLTIWVALDDPPGPVGLTVAPGSHGSKLYGPVEFSAGDPTLSDDASTLHPVPDIDANPEPWNVVTPPASKGDAILMHSRTLHAAGGACAARFRRISVRYAHPETRLVARAWPVAEFWSSHDTTPGAELRGDAFPTVRIETL